MKLSTDCQAVKPEDAGFSSQRLGRINPVMQRYVDERKVAGIVSLVARHGRVVHCGTFGMANIETGTPMRFDTLFRIQSMTKPITSVAVLTLAEEGLLRLTDPLYAYIPAFQNVKVLDTVAGAGASYIDPVRPITIRDLLTHTSGLSYGFIPNSYIDEMYNQRVWAVADQNHDLTLEAFVAEVARLPLVFQPGTTFHYSVAHDVLGLLVQVVSGLPFDQFLKQRIFEPLGMLDTDFWVPPEKVDRLAASYAADTEHAAGLKVIDPPATSKYTRRTKNPSGGSGLVSTASDYLRFAQMLLKKGELNGVRLLGRKTVELMCTNHLPRGVHVFGDAGRGYGLGVGVVLDPVMAQTPGFEWLSAGTISWRGGASTDFWVDHEEDLIGILMLQFEPVFDYPVDADFHALTYQALVD